MSGSLSSVTAMLAPLSSIQSKQMVVENTAAHVTETLCLMLSLSVVATSFADCNVSHTVCAACCLEHPSWSRTCSIVGEAHGCGRAVMKIDKLRRRDVEGGTMSNGSPNKSPPGSCTALPFSGVPPKFRRGCRGRVTSEEGGAESWLLLPAGFWPRMQGT